MNEILAMLDFDLYDYYKSSRDKKIILSFKGIISQQLLIDVGEIIRARSETLKGTKKIFSVFIEMSQNIMHYSKEREVDPISGKDYGVGIVLFHESEDEFIVTSGNLTSIEQGLEIRSKIDMLSSMPKEDIKQYYSDTIRKPRDVEKKGAGLGLIEIVRKSGGKVFCETSPVDGGDAFVIISSYFEKEKIYEV